MASASPVRIYAEGGGRFLVEMISDTRDAEGFHCCELRCLHTIKPSPLFGAIRVGEVFEVSCKIGWESYVGWELSEDIDANA